jgi:thiamine biosynthesis protein ThiC
MGVVALYHAKKRLLVNRVEVKIDQVFFYDAIATPKRELFVHKKTWDGVMISRHLQTGGLYFTVHPFISVLIVGEVFKEAEPILGLPMSEEMTDVSRGPC